jgi:hypothetical protein
MRASGMMLGIFEMFFSLVIRKNFRWEMCGAQGLARAWRKKKKEQQKSQSTPDPCWPDVPISRFPSTNGHASAPASQGPTPPGTVCHSAVKSKISAGTQTRGSGRQAMSTSTTGIPRHPHLFCWLVEDWPRFKMAQGHYFVRILFRTPGNEQPQALPRALGFG